MYRSRLEPELRGKRGAVKDASENPRGLIYAEVDESVLISSICLLLVHCEELTNENRMIASALDAVWGTSSTYEKFVFAAPLV